MDIDINRKKSFSISLTSEGMDISQMQFRFCLELNEMIYSFPAQINGDNLKVVLPPLAEKIRGLQTGTCKVFLETYTLNEDNKGYYLRPWESEVELKKEPRIEASLKEEKDNTGIKVDVKEEDTDKSDSPSYSTKETSDKKQAKQEPVKEWPKPKTRFGKKLFDGNE